MVQVGLLLSDVPRSISPSEQFRDVMRIVDATQENDFSYITISQHFLGHLTRLAYLSRGRHFGGGGPGPRTELAGRPWREGPRPPALLLSHAGSACFTQLSGGGSVPGPLNGVRVIEIGSMYAKDLGWTASINAVPISESRPQLNEAVPEGPHFRGVLHHRPGRKQPGLAS